MPSISVLFVNRFHGRFWSIEELFSTLAKALPIWVKSRFVSAPCERADIRSVASNIRWCRKLKDYDVLHLTGDINYVVVGRLKGKVVLTIHDIRYVEEAVGLRRILFRLLWLYLPCLRADRVTVISEFTKSRLLELCRVNPSKVRVIPNCVSPEFKPVSRPWPAGKARVLLVGTTDNKNLTRVVEACAGLEVRLCILGKPTKDKLDAIDGAGVEHEAHHGLSREAVVELYQSCDLVCFVSTYEGFGMPILEGQAVGRPVITSDLSPMREVAGDGALLVNPFEVSAIRAAMVRLLEDSELREDLVKHGFENVAKYSAESVAAQYAEVYREVVEHRA